MRLRRRIIFFLSISSRHYRFSRLMSDVALLFSMFRCKDYYYFRLFLMMPLRCDYADVPPCFHFQRHFIISLIIIAESRFHYAIDVHYAILLRFIFEAKYWWVIFFHWCAYADYGDAAITPRHFRRWWDADDDDVADYEDWCADYFHWWFSFDDKDIWLFSNIDTRLMADACRHFAKRRFSPGFLRWCRTFDVSYFDETFRHWCT